MSTEYNTHSVFPVLLVQAGSLLISLLYAQCCAYQDADVTSVWRSFETMSAGVLQPKCRCTHVQHACSRPQPAVCSKACSRRNALRCRRHLHTICAESRGAETRLRRGQRGSLQQPCAAAARTADTHTEVQIDVFQWLRNVPWERIGVWLVVVVAALNLKDFFGVRPPCPACLRRPCTLSRAPGHN